MGGGRVYDYSTAFEGLDAFIEGQEMYEGFYPKNIGK